MILSNKKFFTKEHFEKNKGYAPAYLCELVVYCMELLSQLSAQELKFRFKGGNSLLLILKEPERFSIDVDIATSATKEEIIKKMEAIVKECEKFTKLEIRQHQTKPWLPMISFKIYFNSFYQNHENSFVMLDAVLKQIPYPGYLTKIKIKEIYESEYEVEVSEPSGLIGDKLLTISPATLGIPLGKKKEAQRLKHIFDISRLAKENYSINEVKESINNCIKQENEIQGKNFSLKEIKEDTKKFCEVATGFKEKPELEKIEKDQYLYEIVKGFDEFKNYVFKREYKWNDLLNDMSTVLNILEKI
ncbi:MAG TPA: nucleotidyl transferase AbiEii/AbiGii toxin family protein [bacterium]|nr:nucleotidyl transferase AbiEii/AbiGii toxin family protein [bacterium]HOL47604.1 nucleotidyl transferase AbiEii/AbiGii toxin family protein [bacterium]HPQ19404.1 nucleotidyl transferase AbiEii/AbiGii toxin family protein [bacterium]